MIKPKFILYFTLFPLFFTSHCSGPETDQPLLTAELPLHLEEHLGEAVIEGSEVPDDVAQPVEWRFDEPQPDWHALGPVFSEKGAVRLEPTGEVLRLHFAEETNRTSNSLWIVGAVYIDLPDWQRDDWGDILVQAKNSDHFFNVRVFYNVGERMQPDVNRRSAVLFGGDRTPMISDGAIHTYKLSVDFERKDWGEWKDPWKQLVLYFAAPAPGSLDLLSVSVVPKEHKYANAPFGAKEIMRASRYRSAIFTHAPGRIEYRIRVPENGRFDVGLGALRKVVPTIFRILVNTGSGNDERLLEEGLTDHSDWQQRSVDLSKYAGKKISLAMEVDTDKAGSIAFWGAPTVSSGKTTSSAASKKPNVIFYIIDGAAAESMTVYGYNRNTTPNIERLAEQGAVFEYAYSNSSWTDPSTPSFMTSLQDSVLTKSADRYEPPPSDAITMAQRFHSAGYQTGVFTSNPWAGSSNDLQRGVDWFRDEGVSPPSISTLHLHGEFWKWREAYPGSPFWVHFQTTDVHGPSVPQTPFAGMFVPPERYKKLREEEERLDKWLRENPMPDGPPLFWSDVWKDCGIDRIEWFTTERDVYDEVMAHQDYQLGRFVERLKANGDWENTILVIAADHSYRAGSTDFGLFLQNELPEQWVDWGPLLRSTITRVPLIFIWPGHIKDGQRFSEAVSMIDVLPTLLELVGLPEPEVMQGQSLVPLLLGTGPIEKRPVIIDEFEIDPITGEYIGLIEVIDGRWGASLAINRGLGNKDNPKELRPEPLMLYDIWEDPLGLHPINKERPDLVEKYTKFLEAQYKAHLALGKLFTGEGEAKLNPEQLETLRSLGYIR